VNVWATRKSHDTGHLSFQQSFCVNVCTEIVYDNVIVLHVIQDHEEGHYAVFLEETFPPLLEDLSVLVRESLLFEHNGTVTILHIECANGLATIFRKDRLNMEVRSRGFRILPI
jgi:hypothetical protein